MLWWCPMRHIKEAKRMLKQAGSISGRGKSGKRESMHIQSGGSLAKQASKTQTNVNSSQVLQCRSVKADLKGTHRHRALIKPYVVSTLSRVSKRRFVSGDWPLALGPFDVGCLMPLHDCLEVLWWSTMYDTIRMHNMEASFVSLRGQMKGFRISLEVFISKSTVQLTSARLKCETQVCGNVVRSEIFSTTNFKFLLKFGTMLVYYI